MKTKLTTTLRERMVFGLKHDCQPKRIYSVMRYHFVSILRAIVTLIMVFVWLLIYILLLIVQPFRFVIDPILFAVFRAEEFEKMMTMLEKDTSIEEKVVAEPVQKTDDEMYIVHDIRGIVRDQYCKTLNDAEKWMAHIHQWNHNSRCEIIYPKKS